MTTPLSVKICRPYIGWDLHAKFEVYSLSRFRDILGGLKIENVSCDATTPISGTVCNL